MSQPQYWIVVAAKDHALRGIEHGFIQANHGKEAPLRRMHPGDGILIYAPKLIFGNNDSYQQFVASGTVADDPVYQVDQTADFKPFRRKVAYDLVGDIPIQSLIEQLSFITDKKHWGYRFRFGCFAIPQADFDLIRSAMTTNERG